MVSYSSSSRLVNLAGEQYVAHAGRDCGRELDPAEPSQPPSGRAEVVVHLEVFDERGVGIDGQRAHDPAVRCSGYPTFGVGQWRAVEQASQTLTTFAFDEQGASSARCKRQRQRSRHRGLAGAALAGDDMQADAVPVGVDTLLVLLSAHVLSVVGAG